MRPAADLPAIHGEGDLRHTCQPRVFYRTYYMTGESRETDTTSRQRYCHCWVAELSGALLPSFLICASLCLHYNKQTYSIRLTLVGHAAEYCRLTLSMVLRAFWSGDPRDSFILPPSLGNHQGHEHITEVELSSILPAGFNMVHLTLFMSLPLTSMMKNLSTSE